ncbi:MAG: outer membrane protein transport protein [Proteobacteria bacterium]|nr:outer membrane protein transport protein [Pseudomonadota bacterium]
MKTINQKLLATAVAALFVSPAAFATNGTNMTGVGAQSVALGGTGVAAYYGAENVIINPAMIGKGTGTEFTFGGTLFKPSVSNDGGTTSTQYNSAADTNVIPSIALSSRINNNLSFGIGAFGTSGMGVDYSNYANSSTDMTKGLMKAQTSLQIMRFVPTLAYNTANAGVGVSAIVQYGALDINYDGTGATGGAIGKTGSGMASDLGYGLSLGGYYDLSKQFTLGASYTSAINMKYKNQLSTASANFVGTGANQGGLTQAFGDNLEQPAEIKAGAAYTMGNIMLTGDFKQIKWGDAKGYKDFGWQDQNVIALGLKYMGTGYWMGIGYNKADNPIKAKTDNTTAASGTINMFNNIFFPATTEQHFSVGGGYDLTKNVSLEGAVMYAPETTTTVGVNNNGLLNATNTTKHSQMAYTVQAKYKF